MCCESDWKREVVQDYKVSSDLSPKLCGTDTDLVGLH